MAIERNPPAFAPPTLDARMLRTRAALGGTLLAMLQEKPFDQVTVREITRRAGVGYATFFRHYPDKDALLNDLAADQIRELLDMATPILFTATSRAACEALCAYVAERRKLWAALLTGGAAGTMREEFIRQSQALAASQPAPETWLPVDLRVVYATGGVIDVVAWWLQQAKPLPVERMAEILDRLVITPTLAQA